MGLGSLEGIPQDAQEVGGNIGTRYNPPSMNDERHVRKPPFHAESVVGPDHGQRGQQAPSSIFQARAGTTMVSDQRPHGSEAPGLGAQADPIVRFHFFEQFQNTVAVPAGGFEEKVQRLVVSAYLGKGRLAAGAHRSTERDEGHGGAQGGSGHGPCRFFSPTAP